MISVLLISFAHCGGFKSSQVPEEEELEDDEVSEKTGNESKRIKNAKIKNRDFLTL